MLCYLLLNARKVPANMRAIELLEAIVKKESLVTHAGGLFAKDLQWYICCSQTCYQEPTVVTSYCRIVSVWMKLAKLRTLSPQ